MAKSGEFRLVVAAGTAAPSAKISPVFGQRGLNTIEFCKQFNALTKSEEPNLPMRVKVKFGDKKFTFKVGVPKTSYYLFKALNVEKGAAKPGRSNLEKKLTKAQIEEIARKKMADMNTDNLEAVYKMIVGTAKSSGIEIIEE